MYYSLSERRFAVMEMITVLFARARRPGSIVLQGRPRDFGWGSMPRCRLRRRKFLKFDYEMVHSEVYLNTCGQHSAVFLTSIQKTALFCMFSLFNFFIHFSMGGQLTPFAPVRTPTSSCHNL